MASQNGRRPCIIGVAQRTVRKEDGPSPEPLLLWEEVVRAAAADSRARDDVLAAIDRLQVIFCESWPYDDGAGRLAERLRISPRDCSNSSIGGHTPQLLVQQAGHDIVRGQLDVAVVCGGEALATVSGYQRAGEKPNWSYGVEREYPFVADPLEQAVGFNSHGAPFKYSSIDNARRSRLGMSDEAYRRDLGDLLPGMTTVAAQNPQAWFQREQDAETIITPRPDNRWVAHPYTKQMVAIWNVDMAGAIVVASEEAADRMGVPDDRRVYLQGWCAAVDISSIAERPSMSVAPAMREAGRESLRCAGIRISEVKYLDFYSCFPSALNLARDAIGVGDRTGDKLTVTGGLPYSGGPGSDYTLHSMATMTDVLRRDPEEFGLITATGMSLNKQAVCIYNTRPPVGPPKLPEEERIQHQLDGLHHYQTTGDFVGAATVGTFAVQYDRSGQPMVGVAICEVDQEVRAYARIDDPDVLAFAVEADLIGQKIDLVKGEECVVVKSNRLAVA